MKIKIGDIFITLTVLVIALSIAFVFSPKDSDTTKAVIIQNGKVIRELDLSSVTNPIRLDIGGAYAEVIEAEKGRIRFLEADCPDKVCVQTGWISRPGQIAACLPNNTIIKIEGEKHDTDIIIK